MEGLGPAVPGLLIAPMGGPRFSMEYAVAASDAIQLFVVEPSDVRVMLPESADRYVVSVPLRGCFDVRTSSLTRFEVGEAHVKAAPQLVDIQAPAGVRCLVLSVGADAIRSYKRSLGAEAQDVECRMRANSSTGSWVDMALRLHRTLSWGETTAASPIVIREMEDRIFVGLVEAMMDPLPTHAASEATTVARIQRAEDYLEANLKGAVSLADLAHACDTPARSLSRGFRSRHGVGPMRFLRIRRLEAAQRDLMLASPGQTLVTDVALDYGFDHLGRFAGEFRRHFGELPSATLARRPAQAVVRQPSGQAR